MILPIAASSEGAPSPARQIAFQSTAGRSLDEPLAASVRASETIRSTNSAHSTQASIRASLQVVTARRLSRSVRLRLRLDLLTAPHCWPLGYRSPGEHRPAVMPTLHRPVLFEVCDHRRAASLAGCDGRYPAHARSTMGRRDGCPLTLRHRSEPGPRRDETRRDDNCFDGPGRNPPDPVPSGLPMTR